MDFNKLKILHYFNKHHQKGVSLSCLQNYYKNLKLIKADYNEIIKEFESNDLIRYNPKTDVIYSTYKGLHYIRNIFIKYFLLSFLFPLVVAYLTALITTNVNCNNTSNTCNNNRNNVSKQKAN